MKAMNEYRSLLTLLLVISLIACSSQPKKDAFRHQGCKPLEPVLKAYAEQGVFQGSILLAKNGQVLCQRNVGFADEFGREPVLNTSRFPIASLSKPMVATLMLKLQEQGAVDLQATLDTYLPEFNAPWADQVTLDHLLSNRSGIISHFSLPAWQAGRYQQTLPKNELLGDIAKTELAFTPGTQRLYTNLGWILLGEVVQNVTGKDLEANLHSEIFSPLRMQHTGMVYGASEALVTGLRWRKSGGWQAQPDLHMQIFNAGGGVYSTAEDLSRYLHALHQGDLLSAHSKELMFSPDLPYGWRIEKMTLANSLEKQAHNYDGQLQGHSSIVYQILDDDLSLIILSNTGMGIAHKISFAYDILNAFYGVPPAPNLKDAPSLMLNKALLDNQWASVFGEMKAKPLNDPNARNLIVDLARQLGWSGHGLKAIDLYSWLLESEPNNGALKAQFDRICAMNGDYGKCLYQD